MPKVTSDLDNMEEKLGLQEGSETIEAYGNGQKQL